MLKRLIMFPLLDDAGDGGGGGGGSFDSGAGAGGSSTPQAIDLKDDSFVRIPGEKDPVKWSEYSKRYVPKSEFTKSTQTYSQQIAERDRQLQALNDRLRQASSASATPAQQNPILDTIKAIADKPYISGREAAQLVAQVWQGGVQNLQNAIAQRDQLLGLMWKRLQTLDGSVGSITSRSQEEAFAAKLSGWKKDLALPDDPLVDDFLKDVYLSHQGDDLDSEFPNMVKARWEGLQRLINAANRKRAEEARQQTFGIPKKGGNATPGSPLRKKGFQDAKQVADDLWGALHPSET